MRGLEEGYVALEDQLEDLRCPEAQRENLRALFDFEMIRFERDRNGDLVEGSDLVAYPGEADPRLYVMVADGRVVAQQNFRAMAEVFENVSRSNPSADILVHGMGSGVDFELVQKLGNKAADEPERWVEHRQEGAVS